MNYYRGFIYFTFCNYELPEKSGSATIEVIFSQNSHSLYPSSLHSKKL